jgi:hypothetical protein
MTELEMRTKLLINALVLLLLLAFGMPGAVSADTGKLIGQLVDLLGVTRPQAEGGAGAVFQQAKSNMSAGDFSQLSSALPGIDSLIKAAPESGGGLAGKASSMLGSSSTSLTGLSALTDSFSKLGLAPDMVDKYVNVILEYAQSEGGQQAMTLLKSALF